MNEHEKVQTSELPGPLYREVRRVTLAWIDAAFRGTYGMSFMDVVEEVIKQTVENE